MATLSMFFGLIVKMYKERDGRHHRPHIHVQHANGRHRSTLRRVISLPGSLTRTMSIKCAAG